MHLNLVRSNIFFDAIRIIELCPHEIHECVDDQIDVGLLIVCEVLKRYGRRSPEIFSTLMVQSLLQLFI